MADDWKVGIVKTVLHVKEVKFCSRAFTPEGVKCNPDAVNALINMPRPENAGQLSRYLGSMCYMHNAIPRFSELAAPLYDLLTAC
jgi:hypothetical protein